MSGKYGGRCNQCWGKSISVGGSIGEGAISVGGKSISVGGSMGGGAISVRGKSINERSSCTKIQGQNRNMPFLR